MELANKDKNALLKIAKDAIEVKNQQSGNPGAEKLIPTRSD